MKKYYFLIIVTLILGLVLTGCSLLSNISQVPATEQSGINYLTKGGPQEVTLYAGQDINVGTVTVSDDGTNLTVIYNTTGDWEMTETHLYVGKTDPTLLTSAPGQFPYSAEHDPAVSTFTYIIPIAEIDSYRLEKGKKWIADGDLGVAPGDQIYIAAHAEVISTVLTETAIELTNWGRSTESFEGVKFSTILGDAVEEGFGLPIDPVQLVWNRGLLYEGTELLPDIDFATWDQWHGGPNNTWEVRLFQAKFDLPKDIKPENVEESILYSPYTNTDIIPINDNLYIRLNGEDTQHIGTSYQGEGTQNTAGILPETDGWHYVHNINLNPEYLKQGENIIDLVAEEYWAWGGMHRLDLKLAWHEEETAWAHGTNFGTNWATYFTYVIEEIFIETVTVSPDGGDDCSLAILGTGKKYRLDASGTYTFAPGWLPSAGIADAKYSLRKPGSYNPDTVPQWISGDVFPAPVTNYLELWMNGSSQDWIGDYSSHIYLMDYDGNGIPVCFSILDDAYGDNSGSLTVDIYWIP